MNLENLKKQCDEQKVAAVMFLVKGDRDRFTAATGAAIAMEWVLRGAEGTFDVSEQAKLTASEPLSEGVEACEDEKEEVAPSA